MPLVPPPHKSTQQQVGTPRQHLLGVSEEPCTLLEPQGGTRTCSRWWTGRTGPVLNSIPIRASQAARSLFLLLLHLRTIIQGTDPPSHSWWALSDHIHLVLYFLCLCSPLHALCPQSPSPHATFCVRRLLPSHLPHRACRTLSWFL